MLLRFPSSFSCARFVSVDYFGISSFDPIALAAIFLPHLSPSVPSLCSHSWVSRLCPIGFPLIYCASIFSAVLLLLYVRFFDLCPLSCLSSVFLSNICLYIVCPLSISLSDATVLNIANALRNYHPKAICHIIPTQTQIQLKTTQHAVLMPYVALHQFYVVQNR